MKNKTSKLIQIFGTMGALKVAQTFKDAKKFRKQMHKDEEIVKAHKPEFIATDWKVEKKDDLPVSGIRKGQNLTITINMVSYGNKSKIDKACILDYVMDNWSTIKVN